MKKISRIYAILLIAVSALLPAALRADVHTSTYQQLCEGSSLRINDTLTVTKPGSYRVTYKAADGSDSVVTYVVNFLPKIRIEEHVDLLPGEQYVWRGIQIDGTQDTYTRRYTSQQGCDSIYVLTVNYMNASPFKIIRDTVHVCSGLLPYSWEGDTYNAGGQYYKVFKTATGDSIRALYLIVDQQKSFTETYRICEGDVLSLSGNRVITYAGVYRDTLYSTTGCDSIRIAIVNLANSYRFEEMRTISEGQSISWQNQQLTPTSASDYFATYKSVDGCDSVYVLHVGILRHKQDGYFIESTATVCRSDLPYVWRGKRCYETGNYFDSLRTFDRQHDSIYCLHLTVAEPKVTRRTFYLCEGSEVEYDGRIFTEPGIYRDTLQSAEGCDSIVEVQVLKTGAYHITQPVYFCHGDSATIGGRVFTKAGTYEQQLTSINGCDSIVTYLVSELPTFHFLDTKVLDMNENPYQWHGQSLTKSGTYFDQQKTANGCDSVYELRLTFASSYLFVDSVSICQSELPYHWHGNDFADAKTYDDTYRTVYGMDSIYRLVLNIRPVKRANQQVYFCDGTTITLNGKDYSESGQVIDTLNAADGCDSIVTYLINKLPSYHYEESLTLTDQQVPYPWHGQQILQTGTYTDNHQTSFGCDSIYTLHVVVTMLPKETYQTIRLCAGEKFYLHDSVYTDTREVTDTLHTMYGADSIVHYLINQLPTYRFHDTLRISDKQLPYQWYDQTITKSGYYYYNAYTVEGCDSVYELLVNVYPTYHHGLDTTICYQERPFRWCGQDYYESGHYFRSFLTTAGFDSIEELNLTVVPRLETRVVVNRCAGDVFTVRDSVYRESGTYHDTLQSVFGCDSVVVYVVNFAPDYHFRDTVVLTSKQLPYTWHTLTIQDEGTYYDRQKSVSGCDSIYELLVQVQNVYLIDTAVSICESETPYFWRGTNYYESGIYSERHATVNGTDSVYQLQLTVMPTYRHTYNLKLCPQGTVWCNGHEFHEPGITSDTVPSTVGCDSIFTYVVQREQNYFVRDSIHFSDRDTVLWHGQQITRSGIYQDHHQTVSGCDSTYELVATVYPTYEFDTAVTICQSEAPFFWRGVNYNRLGTNVYREAYHTVAGYDSIYQLTLTIKPVYTYHQNINICAGDTMAFLGHQFTSDTTVVDTLGSETGCDSVLVIHVHVNTPYLFEQHVRLNDGETYVWPVNGQSYGKAGTYDWRLQSVAGCDSLYRLYITRNPSFYYVENEEICLTDDSIYEWRGQQCYTTGSYYDSLRTVDGQDSIYRLNLTVHRTYRQWQQLSFCEGGSMTFHGKVYTEPGMYVDSLTTAYGCDSITTIYVNITPRFFQTDTLWFSNKETREWHGQTIRVSGTYYDYNTSVTSGCDSTYELVAIVYPTYLYQTDTVVCESELPFLWHGYQVGNKSPYTYEDNYKTVQGYDSIYQLNVTVLPTYRVNQNITICEGESQWFRGKEYSKSGTYADTLKSVYGCDSILTIAVSVAPSFHVRDTITLCGDEAVIDTVWHGQRIERAGLFYDKYTTMNGCDSIYELLVIRHPQFRQVEHVTICQSDSFYLWRGNRYSELGTHTYEERVPTIYGCDSIYQLNLTINETKETHIQLQTCSGESVTYNGQQFAPRTEAYELHLYTVNGCDSVVYLHVNALFGYEVNDTAYIMDGDSILWTRTGRYYKQEGVYPLYEKTSQGCDSIMRLYLFVHKPVRIHDREDFCSSDSLKFYEWRGRQYWKSGLYGDSIWSQDSSLIDTIYTLDLRFHEYSIVDTAVDVCHAETYTFNDQIITESGDYEWKGYTHYGCDSIIRLHINFNQVKIERYDTLCDGSSLVRFGDTICDEGFYQHIRPNDNGCDTIYIDHVHIVLNFDRDFADTICEDQLIQGNPYIFPDSRDSLHLRKLWGQWNDASGHWEDSTYQNCDSTHSFTLHVVQRPIKSDTITLCEGDTAWISMHDGTYRWLKESGYVDDTIPSVREVESHGCDSIYRTQVYISPRSVDSIEMHRSDKLMPFNWLGRHWLTESGYYSDTVPMSHGGCDSITVLHLIVDTTYYFLDSITICKPTYYGPGDKRNKPYLWEGHKALGKSDYPIYNEGVYFDSLRTKTTNVDSIYELHVRFYPSVVTRRTYDLCEGESVRFGDVFSGYAHDTLITHAGLYVDTLTSVDGCDSINQLAVNMLLSYFKTRSVTISDEQTYTWTLQDSEGDHSRVLDATGVYRDTLKSKDGCDSIVELRLIVMPTYHFFDSISVCESALPFEWTGHHDNKWIYEAGTYYDRYKTVAGYDSIYTLYVSVLPTPTRHEIYTYCEGDSLHYLGKTYTKPGIYRDTLTSRDQMSLDTLGATQFCDSIIIIDFQWKDKYFIRKTAETQEGQPYTWREGTIVKTLTHSGVYYDTLQAQNTCDSIIELTLTVYKHYDFRQDTVVCEQDLPFWWHGRTLNETGVYYDSLQAVGRADSVYCLNLTVVPTAHSERLVMRCEGDYYEYKGVKYFESIVLHDTIARQDGYGCDSMLTITVSFYQIDTLREKAWTKDYIPYIWHAGTRDYTLTQSGIYRDTLRYKVQQQDMHCDSLIRELELTVYKTYREDSTATVCQTELPFQWHGRSFMESTVYSDTLRHDVGSDSIYTLYLHVLDTAHVTKTFTLCEGETLIFNGKEYTRAGQYQDTLTRINGCDSIVTINLHYNPKYFYRESYETNDKHPYTWHGKTYTQSGVYYDTLQSQYGCDSIFELTLTVYKTYAFDTVITICESETPYWWHGKDYYESGDYYDSLQTVYHADSLFTMHLHVLDTAHTTLTYWLCQDEVLEINGKSYNRQGQYTDILTRANGCDSVLTINLQYYPKYFYQEYHVTNDKHPYQWRGKTYTETGVYYDTLQSVYGCDSIFELNLTVYTTYAFDTTATVCRSDVPFWWHGKPYSKSGDYSINLQTIHHADSIYTLHLTVLDTAHVTYNIRLCQGDSATYNGVTYKQQGIYTDTLSRLNGCDSIVTVRVQVMPSYFRQESHVTNDTHPYQWHGKTYSETGVYYDTLQSQYGCDSIFELTLKVYNSYASDTLATICQSDLPFWWHDKTYSESGRYTINLQSVHHTDSVVTLYLTVLDTSMTTLNYQLCQGETLDFNGHHYDRQGRYTDTLTNQYGCDSIITINLQYMPRFFHEEWAEATDKDLYVWRQNTYSHTGTYFDSLQSISGCDSVYVLHLTIWPSYASDTMASVCESSLPFQWHNRYYNKSGEYSDTLQSIHHADSIITLHLTVLDTAHVMHTFEICEGESITFNGITYSQAGQYSDTLACRNGCDSIVTISVQIMPRYFFHESGETTDKKPYIWRGKSYTQPGVYRDSLQTVTGCDSIYELSLTVYKSYYFDTTVTVCRTETPFWWHGKTYNESGTYYDSLQSVHQADSIYTLYLIVKDTAHTSQTVTICEGQTFVYHGVSYSKPGTYSDTLACANGCDSIISLTIQVLPNSLIQETAETDDHHPYFWRGQYYDQTGIYYDSLTSALTGCDSIYELILQVWPTYSFDTLAVVCESDMPFHWRGKTYTEAGTFSDTLQSIHLADSVFTLHLTVLDSAHVGYTIRLCDGETATYNGQLYDRQGMFTDTLTRTNGCDSIVTISVQMFPKYLFTTVAETSSEQPYTWRGTDYTRTGVYYDSLTSVEGCDSVFQLTLSVWPVYHKDTMVTACESELPFTIFNRTYNTQGIYTDTLQTIHHYDSIYTIDFRVIPASHSDIWPHLCEGDAFTYNSHTYTEPGLYVDTIRATNGCDSIVTIHFSQRATIWSHTADTICEGSTYTWHGRELHIAGSYLDTLKARVPSADGSYCDSVYYEFTLVITPAYRKELTASVCSEDLPYIFCGKGYTESGVYTDTVLASTGCDSICTLRLTVYQINRVRVDTMLCGSDVFTLAGRTIDTDGMYRDTVASGEGCGTIYEYNVHFLRTQRFTVNAETSTNKPYVWVNPVATHSISYPGYYSDTVRTKDGTCDSIIYELNLMVYETYFYQTDTTLCSNDLPYDWHGKSYWRDTTVYDSLQTIHHFDSVYVLKLHVVDAYRSDQIIDLCEGAGDFLFRGRSYSQRGIYYDTIPSVLGCDSIIRIIVRVHPNYERWDTVNISDTIVNNIKHKGSYIFRGDPNTADRELSIPGDYDGFFHTISGCDSIVHLHLIDHPTYIFLDTVNLCKGDSLLWSGLTIRQAGDYTNEHLSVYGYDSTYYVHVVVHPTYEMTETHTLDPNKTTTIHGMDISQPGVYEDHLFTVWGCDSIYHIVVNSPRVMTTTYDTSICEGDYLDFYGQQYYVTGTYTHQMANGDKVVVNLTVVPTAYNVQEVVIADENESFPYYYENTWYTRAQFRAQNDEIDLFKTLKSHLGCDSLLCTKLILTKNFSAWIPYYICPGSSIDVRGHVVTQPGKYIYVERLTGGGYYLYRAEVLEAAVYEKDTMAAICQSELPYNFHGKLVRAAGETEVVFKTIHGCDSVYHLHLTVWPSYDTLLYETIIPDYQRFYWDRTHQYYDKSDTLRQYFYTAAHGCDSIISVNLIVVPTVRTVDTTYICRGDTFRWETSHGDSLIWKDGFYSDTIWNPSARLSQINSKLLQFVLPTRVDSLSIPSVICGDTTAFDIYYVTSNALPKSYSISFEKRVTDQGVDDIPETLLQGAHGYITIKMPRTYVRSDHDGHPHYRSLRPGTYTATLTMHSYACEDPRDTTFQFTVDYPSWIIEQKWNNVVAPLCKDSNGGYDFTSYRWEIYDQTGQLLTTSTNPYYYTGSASSPLPVGGYAILYAKRDDQTQELPTCPMYFTAARPRVSDVPHLAPTRVPRRMPVVTVSCAESGSYAVYAPTGERIARGNFESDGQQLTLPGISGCYLISLTTHSGVHVTEKVLIY